MSVPLLSDSGLDKLMVDLVRPVVPYSDSRNKGVTDLRTQVINSASDRIVELEIENAEFRKQVMLLTVACRSLLVHCDPDAPLVDGIANARANAQKILKQIEDRE